MQDATEAIVTSTEVMLATSDSLSAVEFISSFAANDFGERCSRTMDPFALHLVGQIVHFGHRRIRQVRLYMILDVSKLSSQLQSV